jgi:hypothetical protein
MMWKFVIATILLIAVPATGNESLRMTVTPTLAVEPALIRVRVIVEPHEENRSVAIIAESEDYFRASEVELQGERGSRTNQFEYRGLPAGDYSIKAMVIGRDGRPRGTTENRITVTP